MRNRPECVEPREFAGFLVSFRAVMPITGSYTVRTEARGSHWVAWILLGNETKPYHGVLLVGGTEEAAEAAARAWAQSSAS
jgi:hypothetical protein